MLLAYGRRVFAAPEWQAVRGVTRRVLSRQVGSSRRRFATAPPATPPGALQRAMARYNAALEARPILVKSITSAVLFSAGDVLAQAIGGFEGGLDWQRIGRAAVFGGVLLGPMAHGHFNFLEYIVKRMAVRPTLQPFVKVLFDQVVYWAPFINTVYISFMALCEGADVQQRVQERLWPTLKANYILWPAAQIINFKFVPLQHQLNFVLVVSLGWAAYLSLSHSGSATAEVDPAEAPTASSSD